MQALYEKKKQQQQNINNIIIVNYAEIGSTKLNKIVDDNKTGCLYEVKIHTPGTPLSYNLSHILTPVYQPSKTINQIILAHTLKIISTDS